MSESLLARVDDAGLRSGIGGGLLVMCSTWLIPFGPLFAGIVSGYVTGTDPYRGVWIGAKAGVIGFMFVLAMISRFPGRNLFETMGATIGSNSFFAVLAVLFVYVFGLATLGSYIGSALTNEGLDV